MTMSEMTHVATEGEKETLSHNEQPCTASTQQAPTGRNPIVQRPATFMAAAFGVGLGIGVCTGLAWANRSVGVCRCRRTANETLGRSLVDSFLAALPPSLASRIHMG